MPVADCVEELAARGEDVLCTFQLAGPHLIVISEYSPDKKSLSTVSLKVGTLGTELIGELTLRKVLRLERFGDGLSGWRHDDRFSVVSMLSSSKFPLDAAMGELRSLVSESSDDQVWRSR
jgi:hypothetical protein